MGNQHFESLSIYGFSMSCPKDCRVEFNPKSRREEGDVAFHFPNKEKIFLSWGELEKATKSFGTVEEHVEHSLKKVRQSGNVKNFEKTHQSSINVNSHRGVYTHVRLQEVTFGLFTGKRSVPRDAYSLHLHCTDSSRYFVVYALLSGSAMEEHEKTLMTMVNSFKCH